MESNYIFSIGLEPFEGVTVEINIPPIIKIIIDITKSYPKPKTSEIIPDMIAPPICPIPKTELYHPIAFPLFSGSATFEIDVTHAMLIKLQKNPIIE